MLKSNPELYREIRIIEVNKKSNGIKFLAFLKKREDEETVSSEVGYTSNSENDLQM